MELKYANGQRVHVDDPEFDAVFEKCAELKIPVLIHVRSLRRSSIPGTITTNAGRAEGISGRARPPAKYPPFETLMTERNHLFAKHPRTNFIAAHLGFHGIAGAAGETLDANPTCMWISPLCWRNSGGSPIRRTISW